LPIDVSELAGNYEVYERAKAASGRIDFEDMQLAALEAMQDPDVAEGFRAKTQAITVDEFQDVSSVQVRHLEAWLGPSERILGYDYRATYGFRGGSPSFVVGWHTRLPRAKAVTLEASRTSTPSTLCAWRPSRGVSALASKCCIGVGSGGV